MKIERSLVQFSSEANFVCNEKLSKLKKLTSLKSDQSLSSVLAESEQSRKKTVFGLCSDNTRTVFGLFGLCSDSSDFTWTARTMWGSVKYCYRHAKRYHKKRVYDTMYNQYHEMGMTSIVIVCYKDYEGKLVVDRYVFET